MILLKRLYLNNLSQKPVLLILMYLPIDWVLKHNMIQTKKKKMKKKIQDVDKKIHDTRNFVGIHDFNALTKKHISMQELQKDQKT